MIVDGQAVGVVTVHAAGKQGGHERSVGRIRAPTC